MKADLLPPAQTANIFVVEDDVEDMELVWHALRRLNIHCNITHLEDGEKLLKILQRQLESEHTELPQLILLDLNMPVVDGRETLSRIKTNKLLKQIPIIVLTSSRSEKDVEEAYHLGANSVLFKPETLDSITKMVEQIDKYWLRTVKLPYTML